MSHLVLVRHGQSEWNAQKRFTGWVDIDLTEKEKEKLKKPQNLLWTKNLRSNIFFHLPKKSN